MNYREFNFDGLVGPTHNYAGLSYGNVASGKNRAALSNPREAARQGLKKAKILADRGFAQGIFPPHERPSIRAMRSWGFQGKTDNEILAKTARQAPHLLAAASSASAMWTANACMVAPSCDTADGRVHLTPANLSGNLHRSIEAPFTESLLKAIFSDPETFVVHPPLPGGDTMADEGAANHTRLAGINGSKGLHVFVYGKSALDRSRPAPTGFPARQTLESVQAIARLHELGEEQFLFIQQSPVAIDAGVFHNDVISVGHEDTFLYHEEAFLNGREDIATIEEAYQQLTRNQLITIQVSSSDVGLKEAVRTYLFNSQLMRNSSGGLILVSPQECHENEAVSRLLNEWTRNPDNPIEEILSFDLRESMRNGGGPACLRQRILLNDSEASALTGKVVLDEALYKSLLNWVEKHYRDSLHPDDLADPQILEESRRALDELTQIMKLPPIYPFQGIS